MRKSVPLVANTPTRLPYPGRVLQFFSLGASSGVDVKIEVGSTQDVEEFGTITNGKFKLKTEGFTALILTSANDAAVDLLITYQDVTLDGQTITIDSSQFPLDVQEGVATSVTAGTAVAVTAANTALLAANALRKAHRVLNLGPDPVAIGPAGQTWAKRTIVLNVGDVWIEDSGANVAWSAICDAAKTASVTVQEVFA